MTLFILLSFTSDPATSAAPRGGSQRFVLVIDAGHGGKDNGASGKISKEKNINLNIALAFGRMVEANCPDVKVVYTRKTDVFVTLQGRADIANRHKANLFISIHTNSNGRPDDRPFRHRNLHGGYALGNRKPGCGET